jgi:ribonuclease P protein component
VHADRPGAALRRRGARALGLPRAARLQQPSEFLAVQSAERGRALRSAGDWLAMTAAWLPAAGAVDNTGPRLGITVSKRMARRALDRNLVKRIVREAFRHATPALGNAAALCGLRLDVSLRLKRALPLPGAAARPSQTVLRRALRQDADRMLAVLAERLPRTAA